MERQEDEMSADKFIASLGLKQFSFENGRKALGDAVGCCRNSYISLNTSLGENYLTINPSLYDINFFEKLMKVNLESSSSTYRDIFEKTVGYIHEEFFGLYRLKGLENELDRMKTNDETNPFGIGVRKVPGLGGVVSMVGCVITETREQRIEKQFKKIIEGIDQKAVYEICNGLVVDYRRLELGYSVKSKNRSNLDIINEKTRQKKK